MKLFPISTRGLLCLTQYYYDNVGNLTSVIDPRNHTGSTAYDERNRPMSITGYSQQDDLIQLQ